MSALVVSAGEQVSLRFLAWCAGTGVPSIVDVQPLHVASWVELQTRTHAASTVKQCLAAIRHPFDWLVAGQIVPHNLAASVRGPSHITNTAKTPVLEAAEARRLLDSIDMTTLAQANVYAMVRRRTEAAGIATKIGSHALRATGITTYLQNGGTLENAAAIANHVSTRTTQRYGDHSRAIEIEEVERISL